jgi:hypothetical protein
MIHPTRELSVCAVLDRNPAWKSQIFLTKKKKKSDGFQ